MRGTTKLALTLFAAGGILAAYGILRFSGYDLSTVDLPVSLGAGKSYSASFVAQFARYEIGISSELGGLELANWCTTTRDAECVAGLRPFFADKCIDGPPLVELTAWVKTDGQAVATHCFPGASGEPGNHSWGPIWQIEVEVGHEYQIETVVSGDPALQQFEPALIVRVDRQIRNEKAFEWFFNLMAAGFAVAVGLAVLVGGLIHNKLRQKA